MIELIAFLAVAAPALYVAHWIVKACLFLAGWKSRITAGLWLLPVVVTAAWWFDLVAFHTLLLCLLPTGLLVWRRRMRTAGAVTRLGELARRKSGVASTLDIWRYGSQLPVRRKATIVRPSTAHMTAAERLNTPATEFGARIARVGAFRWVWISLEMVCLIVGGPRKGKSGYLGTRIVDAPGAVLATSTRDDLYRITAAQRMAKGPVYVFNAVGLGMIRTSLPFDPIVGCDDPTVAFERASDMTGTQSGGAQTSGDREYWDSEGRRLLMVLLHAAALGRRRGDDCTMNNVEEWRADPERHKGTIASYLRRSPQRGMDTLIEGFLQINDRTRTSITQAAARATAWLTSPAACAATKTGATVDVAELLRDHAAIYLIGAKETQSEALVAGLVGLIAREARRLAGLSPQGRLDPPFSMALDEAGILTPPLHDWTADMGGRGICITAAFQSRAQMLASWSPADAGVTINNAATIMLFGGTKDADDLETWAKLAGEREETVTTTDKMGKVTSSTTRKVPVFTPTQISGLRGATRRRTAQVIVFHDGMPTVLARAHMLWQRGRIWQTARRVEAVMFGALALVVHLLTRAVERCLRRSKPTRAIPIPIPTRVPASSADDAAA